METIDIKAEARSQVGKGSARAARRAGLVPAVIYGNKQSAIDTNYLNDKVSATKGTNC